MIKHKNKLNSGKRWMLALTISALSISLIGCGDGNSDGSAGTAASVIGADRQISFEIDNTSGYEIQSVEVINDAGKQLAKGDLNCAMDANCTFRFGMTEPGTLKFYDKKGALVGAYVLTRAPDLYQPVRTSAFMLGAFLSDELRRTYPQEKPAALSDKLGVLFKNYVSSDGKEDKFEELGQYYLYQIAAGNVPSAAEFIKSLHQKLEVGESLPSNSYKLERRSRLNQGATPRSSSTGPVVKADGGGCPSGITGLATILQNAGNFSSGLGLFGGFLGAFCDVATPEDQRYTEITLKMDEISKKLQEERKSLNDLTKFLAWDVANQALGTLRKNVKEANGNLSYYRDLLINRKVGTFMAFVDSYGSFEKAWQQNPEKMQKLLGNFPEDWIKLTTVGVEIGKGGQVTADYKDRLSDALNTLCNGQKIDEALNIVATRGMCNLYIADFQQVVTDSYLKHMVMLQDITATLEKYGSKSAKDKEFIDKKVTKPDADTGPTWAEQYQKVILPGLNAGINRIADGFAPDSIAMANSKGAYFDFYAGLPKQLLDQFQTDGLKSTCVQGASVGRQTKPVPNITNWVNNGKESYITVICREGIGSKNKFTSNYYLNDGNDVLNMMGVLVGKNSPNTSTSKTYGETDGIGGGAENAVINFPADGKWAVFSTDNSYNEFNGVISPGYQANARIVSRGEVELYQQGRFNRYWTNYTGYSRNGGSTSKLYIRYTDAGTGLSYVLAEYFWRGTSSMRASLGCLGKNCSIDGDDVRFKNGPTLVGRTGLGANYEKGGGGDTRLDTTWRVSK